ncbi:ATPase subunit of ABC transporter with duplicated ATPase domains [Marmoricola sp. OAE513]|uniref:ATP-binding cassette domain-containing protein n=1 Tax=Marmoricola sp. OAE513 TaxID=2817894 RepID=UPI001AE1662E
MPTSASSSVALRDVSFTWPDGAVVLDGVTGAFGPARTGLIGANGAGKSTLLRLVAGLLTPTSGSIATAGSVAYLPQHVTTTPDTRIADLLGVGPAVDALRAIEDGSTDQHHFDAVGDDWDVEERAVAELAGLGLPTGLDRTVPTLSGGETMLVALTGIRLQRAGVALLDEPTNNLDEPTRERLYSLVDSWSGALVVVSHDRLLLDRTDATVELREHTLTTFGGPFSQYAAHLAHEQEVAQQVLATAKQDLRKQQRERIEAEVKISRSERKGYKDRENRKFMGVVFNERRNSAEKSQAGRRGIHDDRIARARAAVDAAGRAVRDDDQLKVVLPDPGVPARRRIVAVRSTDGRDHVLHGPERVGLTGPNGAGKTTLLQQTLPLAEVPVAFLPQAIVLDDDASVWETVRAVAPETDPGELRNRLARLLLRGEMLDRPNGSLSGGERLRVALASLVLAAPAPQLLVLDEPTNNLDLDGVGQLVGALAAYRGALLVVSHDRTFLEELELDVELQLEPGGVLTRVR